MQQSSNEQTLTAFLPKMVWGHQPQGSEGVAATCAMTSCYYVSIQQVRYLEICKINLQNYYVVSLSPWENLKWLKIFKILSFGC